MTQSTFNIVWFLLLLTCTSLFAQTTKSDLQLWYDEPAQSWNEALPIGNGRLGAMVFGGSSVERIQLNEATIWAGEPGNNNPPATFRESLPEIRKLIFEEKYKEAQDLLMQSIPAEPVHANYGMPYQTAGNLIIEFPGHDSVSGYVRALDISKAISSIGYLKDGVHFSREVFSSFVDDVIVMKVTASKRGEISCNLRIETPHLNSNVYGSNDKLILRATTSDHEKKKGRIHYSTIVQTVVDGGKFQSQDSVLHIAHADEVTIYISTGTNFKRYDDISGDDLKKASSLLEKATSKKYENLVTDHINYYQKYFNRVSFQLDSEKHNTKPTDHRINEFAAGNDLSLVPLYFQFGRYLLISSSQPGSQPATLQGLWNEQLFPPWDSKYTININTEMNYWPAEVTNLTEMHEPLFDMLTDLSVTGQQTAKEMYGARGWVAHHNTDLWRITAPVDGAFYGMWPMGGGWLSQHIWQHYLYTGDKEFLEKHYNILKGVALFYADVLQHEPTHQWLVVSPSMSPENEHHAGVSTAAGTTMDNQLVFDVFHNFIDASTLLGRDNMLADTISRKLTELPPMQIGQHGQLQEWLHDWDRKDDQHRHVSHLYGLYPSSQISSLRTPELFAAARQSLLYRGDQSTGWSMGWKVNLWARLLDGDHAYKLIQDQLTPSTGSEGGTYPNLLDAHPPFQIDGNFGCTSGIAEMLLQSHDGAIHLLPALPDDWKSGKITGLKTIGGFTVDIAWAQNKLIGLTIHSTLGRTCRLRSQHKLKDSRLIEVTSPRENAFFKTRIVKPPLVNKEKTVSALAVPLFHEYDFKTEKGKTYNFVFD